MKRYIALLSICLLFFSASTQDSIKTEAEKRTQRQLDSIAKPSGPHRMVIDFTDIKSHMDSLNTQILRLINQSNMASQKRDSLTQAMITIMSENIALKRSNEQYRKDWNVISKGLDSIFWLFLIYVGSLAAQGTYHGYREWKDKKQQK